MMLKVAWASCYAHPLPEGHRFPMEKYELLPQQLIYEGLLTTEHFFTPDLISDELILGVHDADYLHRLNQLELTAKEVRKTGFPLSSQLVEREKIIAQGTIDCCDFAIRHGISMNIAGGTHHAFTDHGEGFCLLNDQAIAAKHLLENRGFRKILIIDLDVHQGNGTAQIFRNEARVFTVSMHGKKNYPLEKQFSDIDVELDDHVEDDEYLNKLITIISYLEKNHQFDFVFYQSGVDVLSSDKLGRLNLSIEGCKKRDELVIKYCKDHFIPLVICMGGGYSPKIAQIIEAHANTYRVAIDLLYN